MMDKKWHQSDLEVTSGKPAFPAKGINQSKNLVLALNSASAKSTLYVIQDINKKPPARGWFSSKRVLL